MSVRLLIVGLLVGAFSVGAEETNTGRRTTLRSDRTAKKTVSAAQSPDGIAGPVVLLQFAYASKPKRLSDGTYSARLFTAERDQVILAKFSEEGLAQMSTAVKPPRANFARSRRVRGNNHSVYAMACSVPASAKHATSRVETNFWLLGSRQIHRLGGTTYYQW